MNVASDPSEPCQCPTGGYCPRFKMVLEGHLHELCQKDERYRALWQRLQEQATGFCGDWTDVTKENRPTLFRCGRCGSLQPGVRIEDLPTDKPCHPAKNPQRQSCCGGSCRT